MPGTSVMGKGRPVQLTITTTHRPATDLGYLLHKNPARVQSFGQAHVLYPEASEERCTVALLLDVDAVGLVRRPHDSGGFALEQYVNDRPYVASSFLSVALGEIFGSAMAGRCKDRPELAEQAIPLEATISVVGCHGGDGLLHRLFEPLGYTVHATGYPLDPRFPQWGESPYYMTGTACDHSSPWPKSAFLQGQCSLRRHEFGIN